MSKKEKKEKKEKKKRKRDKSEKRVERETFGKTRKKERLKGAYTHAEERKRERKR